MKARVKCPPSRTSPFRYRSRADPRRSSTDQPQARLCRDRFQVHHAFPPVSFLDAWERMFFKPTAFTWAKCNLHDGRVSCIPCRQLPRSLVILYACNSSFFLTRISYLPSVPTISLLRYCWGESTGEWHVFISLAILVKGFCAEIRKKFLRAECSLFFKERPARKHASGPLTTIFWREPSML